MPSKTKAIFWFNNDLRVHDQPALMHATTLADELICLFIVDPRWTRPDRYGIGGMSHNRLRFMHESLRDLGARLNKMGQTLHIVNREPGQAVSELIEQSGASHIVRSTNQGWYENQVWRWLQEKHSDTRFLSVDSHTLFYRDALPFSISDLPATFSQFRKQVEKLSPAQPIAEINHLPPAPTGIIEQSFNLRAAANDSCFSDDRFVGGETTALKHIQALFKSDLPAHYKETRNALDGWTKSCKLSPWLANGNLSVREVVAQLNDYEKTRVKNDSTYWIYFELLWREYFQWYAHCHGVNLFRFKGIKLSPLTSYYPERFQKWINGNTPYPIVNAAMNELRETGYITNRSRQIAASCLVNELAHDWRYGAAYFESQLLDYDVGSNWGNWQYLAGVGADKKDKRHFNLEKQTDIFDPQRAYIKKWNGDAGDAPLDSVDAADWPL